MLLGAAALLIKLCVKGMYSGFLFPAPKEMLVSGYFMRFCTSVK